MLSKHDKRSGDVDDGVVIKDIVEVLGLPKTDIRAFSLAVKKRSEASGAGAGAAASATSSGATAAPASPTPKWVLKAKEAFGRKMKPYIKEHSVDTDIYQTIKIMQGFFREVFAPALKEMADAANDSAAAPSMLGSFDLGRRPSAGGTDAVPWHRAELNAAAVLNSLVQTVQRRNMRAHLDAEPCPTSEAEVLDSLRTMTV